MDIEAPSMLANFRSTKTGVFDSDLSAVAFLLLSVPESPAACTSTAATNAPCQQGASYSDGSVIPSMARLPGTTIDRGWNKPSVHRNL